MLHRDLSPCNILLSTSGSVKVADLGIARVMEQGHVHTRNYRGKLVYGSPEALQALTLDVRSDLYALGAVLYELLAGTPPCGDKESLANIVLRALREDFAPLPPDTPPDLAELAMGLVRTEREARRPQSATGALALLREHAQPVASTSELAAVVMAMRSRPDAETDSADRESLLAPGELLAPGHVLVARAAPAPGAPVADTASGQRPAPAQPPVFPLPAEPALPPLPQPSRRVTATLTGPGPISASPGGVRLGSAAPGRRLAGPMIYEEADTRRLVEVSGPWLRAEVGMRAWRRGVWTPSAHAGLGVQAQLRRTEAISGQERLETTNVMQEGIVLALGMGLQYRVRDVLLGVDIQVRRGGPDAYRSLSALWTVGYFLPEGD